MRSTAIMIGGRDNKNSTETKFGANSLHKIFHNMHYVSVKRTEKKYC